MHLTCVTRAETDPTTTCCMYMSSLSSGAYRRARVSLSSGLAPQSQCVAVCMCNHHCERHYRHCVCTSSPPLSSHPTTTIYIIHHHQYECVGTSSLHHHVVDVSSLWPPPPPWVLWIHRHYHHSSTMMCVSLLSWPPITMMYV